MPKTIDIKTWLDRLRPISAEQKKELIAGLQNQIDNGAQEEIDRLQARIEELKGVKQTATSDSL